jgi:hypothetical protein
MIHREWYCRDPYVQSVTKRTLALLHHPCRLLSKLFDRWPDDHIPLSLRCGVYRRADSPIRKAADIKLLSHIVMRSSTPLAVDNEIPMVLSRLVSSGAVCFFRDHDD